MINKEKKCSIIVPVRNGEHFIRQALQSVVVQDYSNWELIIVDDASEDGTKNVVKDFLTDCRIHYIQEKVHIGVSAARNKGLKKAKGNYVVFLDADDSLPPASIRSRIEFMEKNKLNMGIFAHILEQNSDAIEVFYENTQPFYSDKEILMKMNFQTGKRTEPEYVWDKIYDLNIIKEQNINFDELWQKYEDWKFNLDYLRCLAKYENRVGISKEIVYTYCVYERGKSGIVDNDIFEKAREIFLYLKKSLEDYDIFRGGVRENWYHGYVNKTIGLAMECIRNMLGKDETLKEGLINYKCYNEFESMESIEFMKKI